jgi:hypothetical protein
LVRDSYLKVLGHSYSKHTSCRQAFAVSSGF